MHKSFLKSKRALETITAVFMFLLMIAAMTILIAAFVNTNSAAQDQMNSLQQRAQEQISITSVGISEDQSIKNITITNTGTIEVTIRAIYRQVNQLTTLITDPSTPIAQSSSKTIDLTSFGLTAETNSMFFAATQRGTKSMGINEIQLKYQQTFGHFNTSALSIGPLMLTFDSLNWASSDSTGQNLGQWQQTWTIPTGSCAWRLNLTDTDDQQRALTLNQYSGFTISLVSSPKVTTWYLNTTQLTINFNQTQSVVFLWDDSLTLAQTVGNNQIGINNVFLTLFGTYSDGQPFAQTIPFEAITVE